MRVIEVAHMNFSTRLRCVVLGAAVAAGFAAPSAAYALRPAVDQSLQTVTEHVTRGGAVDVPGVQCGTRCDEWWVAEHRSTTNPAAQEQLHRELRTLRARGARVLPQLRALGARLSLLATAGEIGWRIGTGIRTKVLRIGVPAAGPLPTNTSNPGLNFRRAGERSGLWYRIPAPEDAWVYEVYSSAFSWQYSSEFRQPGSTDPWCERQAIAAPPGLRTTSVPDGGCPGTSELRQHYLPEDGLEARGPVEDHAGQEATVDTPTWPGAPQSGEEVRTRVRAALDDPDLDLAERWYAHLEEPTLYADPTTTTQREHECDEGPPAYENPGGNEQPDPFEVRTTQPFSVSSYPTGVSGDPGTALRWGTSTWGGTYLDNWGAGAGVTSRPSTAGRRMTRSRRARH